MAKSTNGAPFDAAVSEALSHFGETVKAKLSGPGDPEDQLRAPTEALITAIGDALGLSIVMHGEVRLVDLEVRPDYGVDVAAAPVGFIEIKRPGKGVATSTYTGHNAKQWQKLKLLPNVLYTDGNEWALYRSGLRIGEIATLNKSIRSAGKALADEEGAFSRIIRNFLLWAPTPPRTIRQLVHAISGLCSLLRSEVVTAIKQEQNGARSPLFSILADDWRNLLFPDKTDDEFADQYAQTVTFALLLARVEGIDFTAGDVPKIATELGKKHSLMGKALAVLTDDSSGGLGVTLDTIVRVVGAVDWKKLDDGSGDAYLHLYENFLAQYDSHLRQETGSYYTPNEAVRFMTRFVDDVLRKKIGQAAGFASEDVVVVDPAMGTGTFLLNVLKQVADTVRSEEGDASVGANLRHFASNQLIGFEKQAGPFAVAELRLHQALQEETGEAFTAPLKVYVADTLDNPYIEQAQLGALYEPIARSRRDANQIKRDVPVLAVIGNPPYLDKAGGMGGWVESGNEATGQAALMKDFTDSGASKLGAHYKHLKNLYIYFWRWATWKVFDAHPDFPSGVIAFITPSSYCTGPGFGPMREYLRRAADEGWIINVSPEGRRSNVNTRFFAGVQEELAIAVFCRKGAASSDTPAKIHYAEVSGKREEKFAALESLGIDSGDWLTCSDGWQDPFRPAGSEEWNAHPLLEDLMPWKSPGVKPNRTWVIGPSRSILEKRWARLVKAADDEKSKLFHETRDSNLSRSRTSIIGDGNRLPPFSEETSLKPPIKRYGYRTFDRQWILADSRLLNDPRPSLWAVDSDEQIFVTELHAHQIKSGPGVTFTALVPDMHHYKGSEGGRCFPLYRDSGCQYPNLSPDLLSFLSGKFGHAVEPLDMLAYIAGTCSHSGYTGRFSEQLKAPRVRVPVTLDATLWKDAVELGKKVIWLHTYGERCIDPEAGRPHGAPQLPDDIRPKVMEPIPDTEGEVPEKIAYDPEGCQLHVGSGIIYPVPEKVWEYDLSGVNVLRKWFGYRKRVPAGRASSALDYITAKSWTPQFTTELLQLLSALRLLSELEPLQSEMLERICTGPLLTVSQLKENGILPTPPGCDSPRLQSEDRLF